MSFHEEVAAELWRSTRRLVELHEKEIALVRREYRCTCARDPPPSSFNKVATSQPVVSPRGDHGDDLLEFPLDSADPLIVARDLAKPAYASVQGPIPVQYGRPSVATSSLSAFSPMPSRSRGTSAQVPGSGSARSTNTTRSSALSDYRRDALVEAAIKKRCVVQIVCAYGLRDADHFLGSGSSDPYCICKVQGPTSHEFRTKTVWNNLNPMWHHVEEFEIDADLSKTVLNFVVMDSDMFKKDDLLGSAELPLAECSNEGFHGCLSLGWRQSTLQVSVSIVLDDSEDVRELLSESYKVWGLVTGDSREMSFKTDWTGLLTQERASTLRANDQLKGEGLMDRLVASPDAPWRLTWDALSALVICYDVFTIPAVLAFQVKPTIAMLAATCIITAYWTIDIIANFFTGFKMHGVVERRFNQVWRRYVKGWLVVDIAITVLDWVSIIVEFGVRSIVSPGNKLLKATRAAKAIRLLSILRSSHISEHMHGRFRRYSRIVTICFLVFERLLLILVLTHCICCIWYSIGVAHGASDGTGDESTWVQTRNLKSGTFLDRYVISFDWAVAQFTPSPTDTHAQNVHERIFKICVDFIGLVTFSTFVSTITGRMAELKAMRIQDAASKDLIWRYLTEHKVPLKLGKRVLQAVIDREEDQRSLLLCEQDLNVLRVLPEKLLLELRVEVRMPRCASHPFFQLLTEWDAECVYEICHKYMQDHVLMRTDELFLRKQKARYFFFVSRGVISYHRHGGTANVEPGGWISEAAIWIDGWEHRGDAGSSRVAEVTKLDAVEFRNLMLARIKWPELHVSDIDDYIKEYVRCFLSTGESPVSRHFHFSDLWSTSDVIRHCANGAAVAAFDCVSRASTSTGFVGRKHVSKFVREQTDMNLQSVNDDVGQVKSS